MSNKFFAITVPFTEKTDLKLLKKAGADELYCGYVPEALAEKWPLAFNIINCRGEKQSFEDFKSFKKSVARAASLNLPVSVTINGYYTRQQYPLLIPLIKQIEPLDGVRAIIVADMGLLLALREINFSKKITLSTRGNCFNSYSVDFFHALGIERVVLPRELTAYEIKSIIEDKKTDIELEIFILHEGCGGFIDGLCMFFHCFEDHSYFGKEIARNVFLRHSYNTEQTTCGCHLIESLISERQFEIIHINSEKKLNPPRSRLSSRYEVYGCRLCDLIELKNYPIKSLKIVGRGGSTEFIADSIRLVKRAIFYSRRKEITRAQYRKKCRELLLMSNFLKGKKCTKFNCYFSPHWVKNVSN